MPDLLSERYSWMSAAVSQLLSGSWEASGLVSGTLLFTSLCDLNLHCLIS